MEKCEVESWLDRGDRVTVVLSHREAVALFAIGMLTMELIGDRFDLEGQSDIVSALITVHDQSCDGGRDGAPCHYTE